MVQECLAVFWLLDDKGVINIPKPKHLWIGGSTDVLGFKLFHEQVSYNETNVGNPWLHHRLVHNTYSGRGSM